jgi:hypothetical protein
MAWIDMEEYQVVEEVSPPGIEDEGNLIPLPNVHLNGVVKILVGDRPLVALRLKFREPKTEQTWLSVLVCRNGNEWFYWRRS